MKIIINDKLLEFTSEDLEKMYVGDGLEATVYRYGDEVLKVYKDILWKPRLDEKQSIALSTIPTKRILLPRRMIYEDGTNCFNGYTTSFIDGHSLDSILDMPMTHLIDELSIWDEDIKLLTNSCVSIADLEVVNILFNGNLYFCDPGSFDIYSPDFVTKHHIYSTNCTTVNNFIRNEFFRLIDMADKTGSTLTKMYMYYKENCLEFSYWKEKEWQYSKYGSIIDKLKEEVKSGETVKQYVKRTHA